MIVCCPFHLHDALLAWTTHTDANPLRSPITFSSGFSQSTGLSSGVLSLPGQWQTTKICYHTIYGRDLVGTRRKVTRHANSVPQPPPFSSVPQKYSSIYIVFN